MTMTAHCDIREINTLIGVVKTAHTSCVNDSKLTTTIGKLFYSNHCIAYLILLSCIEFIIMLVLKLLFWG